MDNAVRLFAARPFTRPHRHSLQHAGKVAGQRFRLAQKAEAAGAKSFRITSTSGDNNLHGTAIIYN
ncbi:DUF1471 domain-containing protein [Pantoea sp.]|uniref:DUF1471 domain-containing protein n=1 Tax=Pantoea sp. TaxID=69393 RepID=UPI00390C68B9